MRGPTLADDWRNQAISRFDRRSVSAMSIFRQLTQKYSLIPLQLTQLFFVVKDDGTRLEQLARAGFRPRCTQKYLWRQSVHLTTLILLSCSPKWPSQETSPERTVPSGRPRTLLAALYGR